MCIRDRLQKRLQLKHPTEDDPWSLILYTDEVTPGNALATQTSRKVYAIYYSFKEMGAAALACEDVWFCLATIRSTLVGWFVTDCCIALVLVLPC